MDLTVHPPVGGAVSSLPSGEFSARDEQRREFALCICTFRRPDKLRQLLRAIDHTQMLAAQRLRIVVVDNCPSASSSEVCANYTSAGRFDLVYVHEPRKGLAHARNAALEAALPLARSIVFIDDDEVPTPGWIEALALAAEADKGAAVAVGPVYPLFERPPAAWAVQGGFFGVLPRIFGRRALEGYTGNSLIDGSVLRGSGLRFLDRFNHTGGEDTFFFSQLRARGYEIAWADQAVTYEWIPAERMSLGWLLKRWYRTGITEAEVGTPSSRRLLYAGTTFARGSLRLVAGTALAILAATTGGWRDRSRIVGRLYTIARGVGLVAHAFGHSYEEYKNPGVPAPPGSRAQAPLPLQTRP